MECVCRRTNVDSGHLKVCVRTLRRIDSCWRWQVIGEVLKPLGGELPCVLLGWCATSSEGEDSSLSSSISLDSFGSVKC